MGRISKWAILLTSLILGSMLLFPISSWAAEKACSQNPLVIGNPFILHGRLTLYNGNPTARIWKIGTKRMLGVGAGVYRKKGYWNLPKELEKKLTWHTALYGDFLVYTFTKSKPGVMQFVCVQSVKNLVVTKWPN